MSPGLFPELDEGAVYLSKKDPSHLLSSYSKHDVFLEGEVWPSVEHYFQAMKFEDPNVQARIRSSATPGQAVRRGRSRLRKPRRDWRDVRVVMMTRAVYTKCKAHPEVRDALLDTGQAKLVENSQYDYFWGCGRDRRGENHYGKVLMSVRAKLLEEG